WGAPIALVASRPYFAAAIVLLAIVGAANSVEDVAVFTLLQRLVPNQVLTRVLGLVWGLAMGGVAIGSVAAPAVVSALGPRPAFALVGSILPLLALLTYPKLIQIDRTIAPAPEVGLVDRVPMFAPLSIATKEQVADCLVPVSVPAGEVVIRAGDPGDRFYIVGEGELDIDAGGRHTTAHAADYFGEIALLHDVPRTATVRAAVDSKLYALRRDDLLSAGTGHSAAPAAGGAIAETTPTPARTPSARHPPNSFATRDVTSQGWRPRESTSRNVPARGRAARCSGSRKLLWRLPLSRRHVALHILKGRHSRAPG